MIQLKNSWKMIIIITYLKNLTYIYDKFYVTSENETYFNGKPFKGSKEILYEEEIVKVLKK